MIRNPSRVQSITQEALEGPVAPPESFVRAVEFDLCLDGLGIVTLGEEALTAMLDPCFPDLDDEGVFPRMRSGAGR